MYKTLMFVAGATALGFLFPSAFERYQQHMVDGQRSEAVGTPPGIVEASLQTSAPAPTLSGRVQLTADPDGHFRTNAQMNGRPIDVLVDTGATYVSMSEATARRLGLQVRSDDFRYKAQTANGETAVALAKLDRLQIGLVEVRDVDVMVSRGEVLSTTLLGMSFLSKLKRFEVQSDKLSLVQ